VGGICNILEQKEEDFAQLSRDWQIAKKMDALNDKTRCQDKFNTSGNTTATRLIVPTASASTRFRFFFFSLSTFQKSRHTDIVNKLGRDNTSKLSFINAEQMETLLMSFTVTAAPF